MPVEYRDNLNYANPNLYKYANFSKTIRNTMSDGVPGRGLGQLNTSSARTWGIVGCLFGFQGLQRYYIGERCMCCLCCLTEGFCFVGQIFDLCCLIPRQVKKINEDIRSVAHQTYDLNSAREMLLNHHIHHSQISVPPVLTTDQDPLLSSRVRSRQVSQEPFVSPNIRRTSQ
ncbi:MAG: hypothetical protein EZS28_026637 [Streblomastix strix]|uniref:TM2 domain-containing protein n=1 Tax=Streblomastix strix TaxID=222440 RepID=A0A5J4V6X4_9EUKA|nr:MAG: hypothetical protein EZS28_026637 [Streblomastix strix]